MMPKPLTEAGVPWSGEPERPRSERVAPVVFRPFPDRKGPTLDLEATHARTPSPTEQVSVSTGWVLVRV